MYWGFDISLSPRSEHTDPSPEQDGPLGFSTGFRSMWKNSNHVSCHCCYNLGLNRSVWPSASSLYVTDGTMQKYGVCITQCSQSPPIGFDWRVIQGSCFKVEPGYLAVSLRQPNLLAGCEVQNKRIFNEFITKVTQHQVQEHQSGDSPMHEALKRSEQQMLR
jgi:hypothetical protein